ncbi:hypothetical protein HMP09_1342 [Sphingomonas sp. HMP9]|uniref:CcdB family protein n=1 Tax=Sphingomonas sp. HMP9 TaxID=1517554 RepID=UPI001596F55B|nr:CcdB family protein [Sphingomonas sp. HMP9]BCA62108.1 hypothetical protein HMP09_1342 [Sphingomonas sp. HMP9]
MAQFDIHSIASHGFVVDCQSDLLSDLRSRIVAPLRKPDEPSVLQSRLNPLVKVHQTDYRVAIQFLRAVDSRLLGEKIGSLLDYEYDVKAAIDMVVSGL